MLNHTLGSAFGYLILSFLTWSIAFAVIVFGVMLRRKILLWDDAWKQTVEKSGVSIDRFAEDLERAHEKVRSAFRLLGFFLVAILALMGWIVYLGTLDKPALGVAQVIGSLWLLALIALSVVLPAFVNFAVGTYLAETMMLKANTFAFQDAREGAREKKAKIQIMEKAKQLKAQREALRGAPTADAGKTAAAAK